MTNIRRCAITGTCGILDSGGATLVRDIKLLIFDFDGTLVDSSRIHQDAFNEAFAPLGINVEYARHAGKKTIDVVRAVLADSGVETTPADSLKIAAAKQAIVARAYRKSIELMPGVAPFLQWAVDRGFLMSIGTSGSRGNVLAALKTLKIESLFSHVVTADDVALGKPDPDIFLKILALAGTSAAEALVIEDSLSGIRAAQSAELEVVCVDPAVRLQHSDHAGVIYAGMSELRELLAGR